MSTEEVLDAIDFFGAYTTHHAMIPGKIETWNFVIDCKDVGVIDFPVNSLASANKRAQRAYKLKLHNIIAINVDWKIKMACKFIYNFINVRITEKILVF